MKTLIGVISGIIVGAIGMEVLKTSNPKLVEQIDSKISDAVNSIKSKFTSKGTVEESRPSTRTA